MILIKKEPQTEMEYWEAIESLGGVSFSICHDLADSRIKDPNGDLAKTAKEASELSERLVSELKKFGVIHPKDCPKTKTGEKKPRPPKGKKYYWDWYEKMSKAYYKAENEKIICSACPFGPKLHERGASSHHISCDVFSGIIYKLCIPFECAMVSSDMWGRQRLFQEISKRGGEAALIKFKIKEAGLKTYYNPEKRQIVIL
jgi:hypothetical protein